ncbi:centrosomal protein of 131 kDa [Leptidea sinapis]|uniref:centrosomal protein of 131 kDa n=1 Tax=Leptidea sinapis TaxID=189913 RepID=UPI002145686F|nr:centrosomal protein of 131 kDa [Leptidea sinapis]
MSKENNNLRLLGSPVNLSYRNKKREDRKNNRNRPRSALQSSCTPDFQERYKRPFSADSKERPSAKAYYESFSSELLQSYNNSPLTVKVFPPTEKLLGTSKTYVKQTNNKINNEVCSNASEYGSEDTFISLGTKIKAKAQSGPRNRIINNKNVKNRNVPKKNRRVMDSFNDKTEENGYGMEITISERPRSTSPNRFKDMLQHRALSPTFRNQSYDSYFLSLDDQSEGENYPLNSSMDEGNTLDALKRRINMQTKQQLSLVEEESIQDLESIPSQNIISVPPAEYTAKISNKCTNIIASSNNLSNSFTNPNFIKPNGNLNCESQTYVNFFNDFHTDMIDRTKMTSTVMHADTSSKDSGYPESGTKEDKIYSQNFLLPSTSCKNNSCDSVKEQPNSLESTVSSKESNDKNKSGNTWTEPLNHSRLLYKDFFLQKEGHLAVPPQNTPKKNDATMLSDCSDIKEEEIKYKDYPTYLLNSSTKAYTSKVIEDYKKEIAAINTLHKLTLKDIKTDAISPTPLNLNEMFEMSSENSSDSKLGERLVSPNSGANNKLEHRCNSALNDNKQDINSVPTKELIENYFKVKGENVSKNVKKYVKKLNNAQPKIDENSSYKKFWNNKNAATSKNSDASSKNPTQRNLFTMRVPLSARLESVQTDKDIESWMSLSAPSPDKTLETDTVQSATDEEKQKTPKNDENGHVYNPAPEPQTISKSKELDPKSTVLDIYSMLKEIESYGENPVSSASNVGATNVAQSKEDERSPTPKDNFTEIFEFLEKVEQSANEALSVVSNTAPQTMPKMELLLKLPQTELAQRLVTASLQLEERSCCIALLQESLANHKEQMISKVGNLEKQSHRNIAKVKQECEEAIKRHQSFIDQLINDKKTLNRRIEELVEERRSLEDRWKRSAQALEERYKLELRNQHDKMAAAQQVARQRWVRQKAEKIKELTVKGLEGELREMAERQQKEVSDLKMFHAEQIGKLNAKNNNELEELRRSLEQEKQDALVKERQLASSRMEKQILELEATYQEQRTRLVAEMRAENERVAHQLSEKEMAQREEFEKWRKEQENLLEVKKRDVQLEIDKEKMKLQEELEEKRKQLENEFEQYKRDVEAEHQVLLKKKVTDIVAQHKLERDREIEKAIESMEAEAQAGRKELQDALRRNKEHYETELKELGETEQATLKRYQDAQQRIRQQEEKCAQLEVTINQLETRNRVLTEKNIQLEAHADEVKMSCEMTWRAKIDQMLQDMETMKKTHEEQMHQLYAKVKVAVARKDSAISAMTRENAKYQEKITLLEQKLQQQRKDFLKSK